MDNPHNVTTILIFLLNDNVSNSIISSNYKNYRRLDNSVSQLGGTEKVENREMGRYRCSFLRKYLCSKRTHDFSQKLCYSSMFKHSPSKHLLFLHLFYANASSKLIFSSFPPDAFMPPAACVPLKELLSEPSQALCGLPSPQCPT